VIGNYREQSLEMIKTLTPQLISGMKKELHISKWVFWGHLRRTYCQHSLYSHTLLLVGSHAAPPLFGTVFPHLYALLTVSLVLGLSSTYMFARHL